MAPPITRISSDISLANIDKFDTIIDVRSPSEFADDHIPGAINLPVLDNQQRSEIGTIYKQISPFTAKRCFDILRGISEETCSKISMNPETIHNLVLTVLPVPPVTIRPSVQVSNGSKSRGQGDLTNKIIEIIKANRAYKEEPTAKKLGFLQHHISSYIDKDNSATVVSRSSSIRSLVQR